MPENSFPCPAALGIYHRADNGHTGHRQQLGPGVYAGPFVPLVTTPSVTLATVSPSAVGASNATFGNVAGATNATLSQEFIASPPTGVNTVPLFYGTVGTPTEILEVPTRPFDMASPFTVRDSLS